MHVELINRVKPTKSETHNARLLNIARKTVTLLKYLVFNQTDSGGILVLGEEIAMDLTSINGNTIT